MTNSKLASPTSHPRLRLWFFSRGVYSCGPELHRLLDLRVLVEERFDLVLDSGIDR